MIKHLVLTEQEVRDIQILLGELKAASAMPEEESFTRDASLHAYDLPFRLRQCMNDFRLAEAGNETICLISGYPVDDQKIGPTPRNREDKKDTLHTQEEQLFLMLCGSLLGEPFGWFTQQHGYLVNDVLPVHGRECQQVGSSSDEELLWHTEDAFHPCRCDYLSLMCLRNPNRGATSVASNQVVSTLSEKQRQVLFEPRFYIRPDEIHFEQGQSSSPGKDDGTHMNPLLRRAYENINKMSREPEPVAVLSGDPASPYMCADSLYLSGMDEEADQAARALMGAIEEGLTDLVLDAGEICFIDNYRTVHGRRSFKANYDGTDRWLKRLNITRDLRKSRHLRPTRTSRFVV